MILVLCRQILVHGGHALLRYPVAAKFGSPQLNRGLHGGQALGGKEKAAERVGNDGGPDSRIVRERLRRELLSADLLADV